MKLGHSAVYVDGMSRCMLDLTRRTVQIGANRDGAVGGHAFVKVGNRCKATLLRALPQLKPEVLPYHRGCMKLLTVLARSEAFNRALAEAVGEVHVDGLDQRASVTMDALMVASQHGHALRALLDMDLGVSGVAMLRLQYEAVLRAVWTLWVASELELNKLSAPLTPATTKAANSLGMASVLLKAIEASQAPDDLKRSLREIRTHSWEVLNSYVHAGLYPLRRHDTAQDHETTISLRMSNGLAAVTCGLITVVALRPARQRDINIVCLAFPECMPPRQVSS